MLTSAVGLTLHASFSGHDVPFVSDRRLTFKGTDTPLSWAPPGLIVSDRDGHVSMFLHHNFTMYKCFWYPHASTSEKIETFRRAKKWLEGSDVTLASDLFELDDLHAWESV